jgi:Meiotically up-regulated gene 113
VGYFLILGLGLIAGAGIVFLFFMDRLGKVRRLRQTLNSTDRRIRERLRSLEASEHDFELMASKLKLSQKEFEGKAIAYSELQNENVILKKDLQNIDVNLRKLRMDRDGQQSRQAALDARATELGGRYLKENIKWLGKSLTANNYAANKQRLLKTIERCRGIGFEISAEEEAGYLADLKEEYEKMVRAAYEREEQARIKAQIREEQKREQEIEQELKRLDRERDAIQAALEKALAGAEDKHSEEVESLRARLAEAEERAKRTKSMAEMTRSGHVYVISNIGSFGEGVFKIGLTRRLDPNIRVRELGDASVPFPFDVHMMISSDDAPTLENALHKVFHSTRLNKTTSRKEFFRTDIETIHQAVEKHYGKVEYTADPEALQYNQSLTMSEEDSEFIESVYDAVEDDGETVLDD